MESFDAIVVGGGPAGSSCAWQLGRLGLDVAVLDRAHFPRDKVCAGWITPQVLEALEFSPEEYAKGRVLAPIHGFRVGLAGARPTDVDAGHVISYGVRRCELDRFLLERSGARAFLGEPLRSLRRDGDAWILNERLRAPMVVGAGGHFCPVAHALCPTRSGPTSTIGAREVEIELPDGELADYPPSPERPELFFERDLCGYGWVVRKGRFVNIGLGRLGPQDLNRGLERFLGELQEIGRLPRAPLGRFRGHAYLLWGAGGRRPVHRGALLVGDALGLAYPQSGEGIRPAVESGRLAARVIAEARGIYTEQRLIGYEAALRERFGAPPASVDAAGVSSLVPARLRTWAAERLLAQRSFARRVVVDRWFLHRTQPALAPF